LRIKQAEQEMHEATAAYHQAKQIEATPGRLNAMGDVLVPRYDAEGNCGPSSTSSLPEIRVKNGCFHVVGAPNRAAGVNAAAMIKHQSQRGELLSDVGQKEQKIKQDYFHSGS
jgi:hypothetical protein